MIRHHIWSGWSWSALAPSAGWSAAYASAASGWRRRRLRVRREVARAAFGFLPLGKNILMVKNCILHISRWWNISSGWATNYSLTSSRSRPSAPTMEDGSDHYENTRHQDSFNDYSDYDGMYERRWYNVIKVVPSAVEKSSWWLKFLKIVNWIVCAFKKHFDGKCAD